MRRHFSTDEREPNEAGLRSEGVPDGSTTRTRIEVAQNRKSALARVELWWFYFATVSTGDWPARALTARRTRSSRRGVILRTIPKH